MWAVSLSGEHLIDRKWQPALRSPGCNNWVLVWRRRSKDWLIAQQVPEIIEPQTFGDSKIYTSCFIEGEGVKKRQVW